MNKTSWGWPRLPDGMGIGARAAAWRLAVGVVTLLLWGGGRILAAETDGGRVEVDLHFYGGQSEWASQDVTALAETPEGLLRLGTHAGMCHFDGAHFVEDPELPAGAVRRVAASPSKPGTWAALLEGGRIVVGRGTAWEGALGLGTVKTLPGDGYLGMDLSADGRICGVGRADLTFFDRTGAALGPIAYPAEFSGTIPHLVLARANGEFVFAVGGAGLWSLQGNLWTRETGTAGEVSALVETRKGVLWGTDRQGVLFREPGDGGWTRLPHGIPGGWLGKPTGLAVSSGGDVWVSSDSGGLWCFDGSGPCKRACHNGVALDSKITSMLMDSDDQLWLGFNGLGLAKAGIRTTEEKLVFYKDQSLRVRALAEGNAGEWILGSPGVGWFRWTPEQLQPLLATGPGANDPYCNAILPSEDGSHWAAGGFGLYPVKDGALMWGDGFGELFGKGDSPMALRRDTQGRILAGTRCGILYAFSGRTWAVLDHTPPARNIMDLACMPDGDVWMGTYGNGMLKLGKPGSPLETGQGLRSKFIVRTYTDGVGRLWVGSESGGLAILKGGKFFNFGPEQGVDVQTVNQILDDGAGRLWVGGNRGIFSLRMADMEAVLRGEQQKLSPEWMGTQKNASPNPCPIMSPVKAKDGRLAFGTNRGFLLLTPPPLLPWPQGPPVKIEKVLLMGQPVAKTAPELTLTPEARHFEVFWTGISLKWAENMSFRYRIKGGNDVWHEVGNERRAVFGGLAPGDYVLELSARIGTGPWSEDLTRLHITSVPVVWQSWWFPGAMALATATFIAACAYLVFRGQRKKLAAWSAQEKAIETERVRIARDLHDHLGATISEMAIYSQIAQSKVEAGSAANNYLERILKAAQSGARALGEIIWATDPAHDTLTSFVSQVAEMVRASTPHSTRTLLPLELPPIQLSAPVRQHLYLALKEALNNLHKHASATEITLEVDCREEYLRIVLGDNGCGFEPGAAPAFGSDGLKNMRDRLEQVGGKMTVETHPGQGTALTFAVPLKCLG
ncbi:MAG: Histidine kinase [Verrucomicrobiales bacterium]|nr:Histidine kinase [Verrucomicrobiales bacterium]